MYNRSQHIRVIVAGGGTGGHIFPGIAIASALKRLHRDIEILFVGAKGKMEMQKIPEVGFSIKGIEIAGYNRSSIFKNLSLPYKLIKSYFQVRKIFRDFEPTAVIGVGGYSSFPVLRVAQRRKIPTYIHESNSLPGKTNLILGKRARKVFVAHAGMEKYFHHGNIVVTGNPIRQVLEEKKGREESLRFFGMNPALKTILVLGGSLGARSINNAIMNHLDFFEKNNLQLIWQMGKSFVPDKIKLDRDKNLVQAHPFINNMEMAYGAADIVVARAGAMTIAELKAQQKASILIPYPFAAEDHQTVNAMDLVNHNAALMVKDSGLNEKLIPAIGELIADEMRIKTMEKNIGEEKLLHADDTIANEILNDISNS